MSAIYISMRISSKQYLLIKSLPKESFLILHMMSNASKFYCCNEHYNRLYMFHFIHIELSKANFRFLFLTLHSEFFLYYFEQALLNFLITFPFTSTILSNIVHLLPSEWCLATSFYQRSANHVYLFLGNLLYLIYLILIVPYQLIFILVLSILKQKSRVKYHPALSEIILTALITKVH